MVLSKIKRYFFDKPIMINVWSIIFLSVMTCVFWKSVVIGNVYLVIAGTHLGMAIGEILADD
jgi:hypothetical protein